MVAILGTNLTTLTLSGFDHTWEFITGSGLVTAAVCLALRQEPAAHRAKDENATALMGAIEPRPDRSTG